MSAIRTPLPNPLGGWALPTASLDTVQKAALRPEKQPLVLIAKVRLGMTQSWPGCCGIEKNRKAIPTALS
jgi:hypothetical protein